MGPYDDPEYGPGYWEPEGQDAVDDAFAEGAASRDAEVSTLLEEREEYEREIAGLKAERARWAEVARAFWRRETFEALAKASEDLCVAEHCLARDESDTETRAWRDGLLRQWRALDAACAPLRGTS